MVHLPFNDGHCPPLPLILDFCIKARNWLKHGIHDTPPKQQQQQQHKNAAVGAVSPQQKQQLQEQQQQQQGKQGSRGLLPSGDDRGSSDAAGSSAGAAAAGGGRGEREGEGGGEFVFELGDEGSERSDSFSSLREADAGAANDGEGAAGGVGGAGGEVGDKAVPHDAGETLSRSIDEGARGAGEGGEIDGKSERAAGAELESKGNDALVVGGGSGEVEPRGVEKMDGVAKDEKRVIVVHCKAGMGRTGLMVSALLMFLDVSNLHCWTCVTHCMHGVLMGQLCVKSFFVLSCFCHLYRERQFVPACQGTASRCWCCVTVD